MSGERSIAIKWRIIVARTIIKSPRNSQRRNRCQWLLGGISGIASGKISGFISVIGSGITSGLASGTGSGVVSDDI
jgi:hypothetical protein